MKTLFVLVSLIVAVRSDCVDSTESCKTWVANGFCTNPQYPDEEKKKWCAKSCGLCDGCFDASASCADWARNGFCTDPAYTDADRKKYCMKTCNLCDTLTTTGSTASPTTTGTTTIPTTTCGDRSNDCAKFAANCDDFPDIAVNTCPKTCNKC